MQFAEMEPARELLRRAVEECGASTPGLLQGKDAYLAAHALAVSRPRDKETLLKQFRQSLRKVCCTQCVPGQLHQCCVEL